MKNKSIIFIVFILVFTSYIFFAETKITYAANKYFSEEQKKDKIILIDPGHGGIDGGAVSKKGTVEKEVNLNIGLKLKENLEKQGYKVIMTREDDIGLYEDNGSVKEKKRVDLNNRCKIKNDSNCDMFISIHLNMFTQSQYYGAQVWYSDNDESKEFARIVQQNLIDDLDNSNKRKEKPAKNSFKILRCRDVIPSIIVECGFLSNPQEEEKLKEEYYQQKIADSLLKSINMYYDNIS